MLEQRVIISDLLIVLENYLNKEQIAKIYEAYIVAANAHDGQYRESGEAYVSHPLSVAMILAKIKLDYESIIAAILHDCIEDTSITEQQIYAQFGESVAHIVAGVSKINNLANHNVNEKHAKNFRKLLIAASQDARVIIIKLADRLHNMRTIYSMPRDKQLRIAKETEDIYIQISRRCGIETITKELKILSFCIINPYRYKVLNDKITIRFEKNKHIIQNTMQVFKERLKQAQIKTKVKGRKKDVVSVYCKMRNKKLKFEQVLDLYAIRIIVDDLSDCYSVLGIVHNAYKPVPGKFKDYIAMPKDNGYQSLHTVIFAKNETCIEVQIRSSDMHSISEYGLASHWYYKNSDSSKISKKWLSDLPKDVSAIQFLEHAKSEISSKEVFVFTPMGDIIKLPYLTTALDFAYLVHTDIGNNAMMANIDGVDCNLNSKLKSGQIIKIITSNKITASIDSLNMVTTLKARTEIKNCLRKNFANNLFTVGEKLLTDALYYQRVKMLTVDEWQDIIVKLNLENQEQLFIKLALNELLLSSVLNLVLTRNYKEIVNTDLENTKHTSTQCANCCNPVFGDAAVGVISGSKGLVLHRKNCKNIIKNANIIKVNWSTSKNELFKTQIQCKVSNQRGALSSIASIISQMGINIIDLELKENNINTIFLFTIEVVNISELLEVISALEKSELVKSASRILV